MPSSSDPTGTVPPRSSRPTLRDVAREAGLSVTQASRALNDHTDVAEATKLRAREAAARIGYTPNLQARRLRDPSARTDNLGIILPGDTLAFSDPFFGDLLSTIATEAGSRGLQLNLWAPPTDVPTIEPYETAIRDQQVDGFILVRIQDQDPRVDYLLERKFPFVAFGEPQDRAGFAAVGISGAGMRTAIDYLVSHGHRRIGCLAEPGRFAIAAHRVAVFTEAAASNGLDPSDTPVVVAGFDQVSGLRSARELLLGAERPTAMITLNDHLALGAIQAAAELDMSIPGDLSVVGSDDIAVAALATPSLTTLRLSSAEIGAVLVDELTTAIAAASPTHSRRTVSSELVVRQSTGPAPSAKS